jgi:4'-phosphopantetheinyl transferase
MRPSPGTSAALATPAGPPPRVSLRLRNIESAAVLPEVGAMLALLHDGERARAVRTADPVTAGSFIAGRFLLRLLTAELLGVPAADLVPCFSCPRCGPVSGADHGRPAYLLDGVPVPLALSLSRAGGFALLGALDLRGIVPAGAGALLPSLGVDLAAVATVVFDSFDDVALTPGERRAVRRLPAAHQDRARARLWTRKEALVKALGTGFAERDPDTVGVLEDSRITDLHAVDGAVLEPLGLIAAVAVVP